MKQWQNFSPNLGMKNEITLRRGMEPWDLKVTYLYVIKVLPSFYM
jgi:hypothetical protein